MAFIWNVMLSFGNDELWEDGMDEPLKTCPCLERINDWIPDGRLVDLVRPTYAVKAGYGMDVNLFGGGFKKFDIDAFISVVEAQPWKDRKSLRLWVNGGQEAMGEGVFELVRLRLREQTTSRIARHTGVEGTADMNMDPVELARRQKAILDRLENAKSDRMFRGRLYRDGIPSPEIYLKQRVRVVFVFREPNLGKEARAHDMCDEIRNEHFRPLMPGGTRRAAQPNGWWNRKVGLFAHAVAAALDDEPWQKAFRRFREGGWHHDVVNRFGYVQIKKRGGHGTSDAADIRHHAEKYADTLRQQMELYRPHLVIGGGVGSHSPARLLSQHVLDGGRESTTKGTGAAWWEFPSAAWPRAMVQLWHPASRKAASVLYEDAWRSVKVVVRHVRPR